MDSSTSFQQFQSFSGANLLEEELAPRSAAAGTPGASDADLSFSELSSTKTNNAEASTSNDTRSPARTRDEKLQNDLYALKKINDALSAYNDALSDAHTSSEIVAQKLDTTDRLLDKYVDILWQSEQTARLVFDKQWHGRDADEQYLEELRAAAEERKRRAREERERAAQLERERVERERLEAERRAKEQEKAAKRGTAPVVRGVRGLRARGTAATAGGPTRGGATAASSRGRVGVPRGSTRPSRGTRGI